MRAGASEPGPIPQNSRCRDARASPMLQYVQDGSSRCHLGVPPARGHEESRRSKTELAVPRQPPTFSHSRAVPSLLSASSQGVWHLVCRPAHVGLSLPATPVASA